MFTADTEPTLQRRSDLCIPRNQTARPQSQFPHSCTVSVSNLYTPTIFPTIFLQQNRPDRSWEYINRMNRSQKHECRNWERGRAISYLGIFLSYFRYSVPCSAAVTYSVTKTMRRVRLVAAATSKLL